MQWITHLLAVAAPAPDQLFQRVLPWAVAFIVLAVVGGIAIYIARRAAHSDAGSDAPGFTLQSLREMHDRGDLSDEEFERARQAMIGQVKGRQREPDREGASPPADNPPS